MFESEEPDSSVLRKSMSEDDQWEKEEVEEVVFTSSTDCEQAADVTLNSLSFQEFGIGELAYVDEQMMSTSRSITEKWIKGQNYSRR